MTAVDPPRLEAVTVGEAANAILGGSRRGRVEGVYRGAVNVSLRGRLVSLVPEPSDRGPININVALPDGRPMSSFGLQAGDKVRVYGTALDVGGRLLVSTRSAGLYSPSMRFEPVLPPEGLRRNLLAARRTGLAHGNLSGLGELLRAEGGQDTRGSLGLFASAAAPRIEALEESVRRGDAALTARAVSELTGLGPGLTPSSDDMLAGMALFMVLCSRSSHVSRPGFEALLRALGSGAGGRTTALSEAYLKEASAGRGNEAVVSLCEALLTGREGAVVSRTRRLLGVGETSGTDTLLGVVIGGELCVEPAHRPGGHRP